LPLSCNSVEPASSSRTATFIKQPAAGTMTLEGFRGRWGCHHDCGQILTGLMVGQRPPNGIPPGSARHLRPICVSSENGSYGRKSVSARNCRTPAAARCANSDRTAEPEQHRSPAWRWPLDGALVAKELPMAANRRTAVCPGQRESAQATERRSEAREPLPRRPGGGCRRRHALLLRQAGPGSSGSETWS
jgi:hypothetical protein